MPAPLDLLYRLSDRDAALPLWGFISKTVLAQAANTSVITTAEAFRAFIPEGHLLFVTEVGCSALPGLGQAAFSVNAIVVDNPGPSQQNILVMDPETFWRVAPPANAAVSGARHVDFVATADEYGLIASGFFDAGVQVNSVRLFFSGYVMPRGNYSRF